MVTSRVQLKLNVCIVCLLKKSKVNYFYAYVGYVYCVRYLFWATCVLIVMCG